MACSAKQCTLVVTTSNAGQSVLVSVLRVAIFGARDPLLDYVSQRCDLLFSWMERLFCRRLFAARIDKGLWVMSMAVVKRSFGLLFEPGESNVDRLRAGAAIP